MTTVVIYSDAATIFAAVCACIFIIVGVLGNLITIIALVKNPKLRGHATTAFVLSLCTSDLLFCSFSLPLTALRYIYKAWLFGDTLCKIFPVIFYSNVAVSLLSMVGITLNRYILISYHSYYARIYRPMNISFQLMFVWLIAILIMIPPLFGWWGQVGLDEATFSCTILEKDGRSIKKFLFLVGILIPCVIIICSYACIYSTVIRQRRRLNKHTGGGRGTGPGRDAGSVMTESKSINKTNNNNNHKMYHKKNVGNSSSAGTSTLREREDSRLTAMMLLIFSCFILCFLPLMFANVFDGKGHYPWLQLLASIMAWASSVINPFIYAATNRNYRVAYYKLFTNMKFWGQPLSPMPSKSFMPSKASKDLSQGYQSNIHNNINDHNRNNSSNSLEDDRIGIGGSGDGGGGGSTDPITESHHQIHQLYDTKNGHLSAV